MEKKLDLRLQKTYLALRSAFTELLDEKQFDELTVNELCSRAMIRRTTFYKHFTDKYDYFAFYIREMVSSLQRQFPTDVPEEQVKAYFLYMSQELLRFLHQHARMVDNIRNSSMFPLLMSIMLDQITGDIAAVLSQTSPALRENPEKRKGIAAFYAGGMLNTYFRLIQSEGGGNENLFLEIMDIITNQMTY